MINMFYWLQYFNLILFTYKVVGDVSATCVGCLVHSYPAELICQGIGKWLSFILVQLRNVGLSNRTLWLEIMLQVLRKMVSFWAIELLNRDVCFNPHRSIIFGEDQLLVRACLTTGWVNEEVLNRLSLALFKCRTTWLQRSSFTSTPQ